jgi:acyl-CoA thioester hydrolase
VPQKAEDMIAAPFSTYRGEVRPGWVDDNNHMNLAYYLVLFDAGSDAIFEALGIGESYRHQAGCTSFAAETHLVYEREMNLGDMAVISTTIIDIDSKRLHLAHEMFCEGKPDRVCLQEIMFISVNLATRRAAPWTPAALTNLQTAHAAHNALPRPAKLGRHIKIPSK